MNIETRNFMKIKAQQASQSALLNAYNFIRNLPVGEMRDEDKLETMYKEKTNVINWELKRKRS